MVKIVKMVGLFIGFFGCFGGKRTIDQLTALAAQKPDNPKIHYQLAYAYARMDSGEKAIAEYKVLLQLDSTKADDPYLRLKVAISSGIEPFPITQLSVSGRTPDFAWKGQEILFESGREEVWQIYLTDLSGKSIERITHDTITSGQPAFGPDNSTIVYSQLTNDGWKLALIRRGEEVPRVKSDIPGSAKHPTFSPDGNGVAFQWLGDGDKDFEIAILNLETSKVRVLTDNIYWDGKPRYSYDGKWIVYHSNQDLNYEIYIMDRQGKNQRRLTENTADDFDPCFLGQDNSRVVFVSNRDGNFELYLMDLNTGEVLRLTNNGAEDREPISSSDGRWICFRSGRFGGNQLFVLDLTALVSRKELAKRLEER